MRPDVGAWRGILLAATLLLNAQTVAASGDPAAAFVRVAKREISGKTGRVVKAVEVFHNGVASLKDAEGKTVVAARLSPDELAAFNQLLADPATLASLPECGAPLGADLPSAEIVVQQQTRTVVVKVERHCRLPAPLDRVRMLLDEVERRYLARQ